MEEYLTTQELSQRIKMTPGTIRNMVSNGKFIPKVHYVKPTRKKLLFVWSKIEEWLYAPGNIKAGDNYSEAQQKPKSGCWLNI